MSPSVLKSNNSLNIKRSGEKYKKIKKRIFEYQKFIEKNFEYVGKNFAHEVRSIHYKNKKKQKGIYGSASKEEVKELRDEGIETEVIQWIKDKDN